jgi:phenylalanyl-tRNA synthetase beta chain
MRFSEHWLRTFVDPALDSEGLAQALTMAGLEVEAREPTAPPFTGVVVGKVLTVDRHPNADRLSLCSVDAGFDAALSIVCGAPNVVPGIAVPCAVVGASLPGGLMIRKTAVRGIESQGMLCSAKELGLSDDASGLLVLETDAPAGADLRVALDLDDNLFTLKLTPNRADCLSLVGLAREVAAITAAAMAPPAPARITATRALSRRVHITDAAACPRFCARMVSGIDARAKTPTWMKQRLERSGIRSISAVVDITNYVMLELGQPLHAYDDSLLNGDLVVRFPEPGETLTLLNGQRLELTPDLLLVADADKPLGLAGIMGGEHSGISDATTTVFVEAAFWNPAVIQGKSRRLGFATDAGFRFERGVDFANAPAAVDRATQLIQQICGGQASDLLDVRGALPARNPVTVRRARIARILGVDIADELLAQIFSRLDLHPARLGDDFLLTPPSYRFDLAIEEDFIEEAARLYGFDNIYTARVSHPQTMLPAPEGKRSVSAMRQRLVDRDFQEVITFSFVSSSSEKALAIVADPVKVLNPIASHMDVMRSSLLGGLLDTLRANLNRKHERVRIFECGRCFFRDGERYVQPLRIGGLAFGGALAEQWGARNRAVDFFDLKSDVASMVAPQAMTTEKASHPALHPGRSALVLVAGHAVGWMGELHPRLVREWSLSSAPVVFELDVEPLRERPVAQAKPVSRLPVVRRDLAVVLDEGIPAQAVMDSLWAVKPPGVEDISVFDDYRGAGIEQGKKSLAILVLIQDTERTLTDAEIDALTSVFVQKLESSFGATLRK